jgi:hypothetical protein
LDCIFFLVSSEWTRPQTICVLLYSAILSAYYFFLWSEKASLIFRFVSWDFLRPLVALLIFTFVSSDTTLFLWAWLSFFFYSSVNFLPFKASLFLILVSIDSFFPYLDAFSPLNCLKCSFCSSVSLRPKAGFLSPYLSTLHFSHNSWEWCNPAILNLPLQ